MSVHTIVRVLRLYLRSELLVGEIRLKVQVRKLSLLFFATLIALMALVFLNIAAYQWLLAGWGAIMAPLILAIANIVLAIALVLIAAFTRPGPDLAAARELRDLTSATLESELKSNPATAALGGMAGINGLNGWDSARFLVPIISSIIRSLRRRKTGS
ncbi:hypothetical protein IMCC20628_01637 [Hoeflea sp. IMCC20628]|uniref:hypothetical protein n=1 Tax=Hoeflea sp. IMCC20628 TaxID=1620421 RepID=UPI00063B0401|nr:hypothetical protein [Hoeflea sp. IMCC20628]AKI00353.1 hypothetical protein IMCC20628_01637 [Hoeflea sp. IMCC20628]